MSFVIDDAFLPATLTAQPMTDEQFEAFCAEHPDAHNFEMTAEGDIIVVAPHDFLTGVSNCAIGGQLADWARKDGRGIGCAARTGFVLPNGARRSPDCSWTLRSRITSQHARGFWHLCPDLVIEVQSDTDRLRTLQEKMREYMENGAQLGWLIGPSKRFVEVYRHGGKVSTHKGILKLEGDSPVAGFVLDLTRVWDPLAN
jgi:Uma2 family endonuclease